MQHYALFAFKKVLLSGPSLIAIFRAEGVWDFIFSESFFYFDPVPAEYSGENWSRNEDPVVGEKGYYGSSLDDDQNAKEVKSLQLEVISFVEFAATLTGCPHNLVGYSSLCDIFSVGPIASFSPIKSILDDLCRICGSLLACLIEFLKYWTRAYHLCLDLV